MYEKGPTTPMQRLLIRMLFAYPFFSGSGIPFLGRLTVSDGIDLFDFLLTLESCLPSLSYLLL